MKQRSPGRPGNLREATTAHRRRRRGRAQVRADDRLIETLRTGLLDRGETCSLTDRLTRMLVHWRHEVLDGSEA